MRDEMNIFTILTPKSQTEFIEYDSTIRQALETFDFHKFTVVPLIDDEGKYVSTLSEGDILRYIKNEANFDVEIAESVKINTIEKYRSYEAITIDSTMDEVLKLAMNQNFVPIIDDRGMYIGIIKRKDIIKCYINEKHLD
jgi:predicted transcriptional regulator